MTGVCLRRVPRPNGTGPRVYWVQRGNGPRAYIYGLITERDDGWDAMTLKATAGRFPSCKFAIRALVRADEAADPGSGRAAA